MPMNHRLLVPRQTTHPEALAWRNAAIANGDTGITPTMVNAVSRLFFDIAAIRSLFYRMNLWVGSGLSGVMVPQIRGPVFGGTTYGGTADTNVNLVGGDYSLTTGIDPGATNATKYINTGFPANTIAAASAHLGFGLLATESRTSYRTLIAAFNGASNSFELAARAFNAVQNSAYFTRYGTASDTFGDNIGSTGATLAAGNIVAAYPTMFRNGVASGAAATTSQDYPSAHNFYVFAANNSGSSVINHTNARGGWYSIGLTMTAAQALVFSTAINRFYTAIGRS